MVPRAAGSMAVMWQWFVHAAPTEMTGPRCGMHDDGAGAEVGSRDEYTGQEKRRDFTQKISTDGFAGGSGGRDWDSGAVRRGALKAH